jgi:cytochrome c5
MRHILALLAVGVSSMGLLAQSSSNSPQPAPAPAPAAAAQSSTLVNPVKPTAASQAQARKTYGYDCAMCHGEKGDGKGDIAVSEGVVLTDYTKPDALKNYSDGDLFLIIRNGKGKMPQEGDRASDDAIWNLVIYLRSMSKKPAA